MEERKDLAENKEAEEVRQLTDEPEGAKEQVMQTEAAESAEESSEPEKIFCVKCGAEVAPGNAFCPKCGQKVGEKIAEEKGEKSLLSSINSTGADGKSKVPIIAGIAGAIVALIVIIFVVRGPQPKDVTLNKKDISVKAGETVVLSYTINPSDIAKVSDGTVTGVNEGDCSVTVTTKNGKTDTCQITVLPAGPDLQAIYNDYCSSSFATLATDGSYLNIDTNPSDKDDYNDYEAYVAVTNINAALGLPDSVINRMNQTRSMDGIQTYTTDDLEISWTYHPNRGLEVSYTLK